MSRGVRKTRTLAGGPGLSLVGEDEIAAVVEVLSGRKLSRYSFDDESGVAEPSHVLRFEHELTALTGARHCLGTNSCTSALFVGLLACGIGPGDEVILPGYTFIAPIAAVVRSGAEPVLAEIDAGLLLDPADVRQRITPRTKAVVAVHMLGAPCDLDGLAEVADDHGLMLVEDCAQAGGGTFQGRHLGTVGHFGAFSLNVFKTFTAGDGGVLLTNDGGLYQTAFALHDHGVAPLRFGVTDGPALFGLNLRMHELTGAVARVQLGKLSGTLDRLRQMRDRLAGAIGPLPGATERPLHDRDGDCATVLAYTFESAELAAAVASRLGTITLDRSGKHNYANMAQLRTDWAVRKGSSSPTRTYALGSLPRTDDLLRRTIALSVGVVDSYLGTSFGVDLNADDQAVDAAARIVREAVSDVAR